VVNSSFVNLKVDLDEACAFLRQFTLGNRGFTQRDGVAAMDRVSEICDQMKTDFSTGPNAADATTAVASGRTRIEAAKARLALLRGANSTCPGSTR
jgi:hypothetical protein